MPNNLIGRWNVGGQRVEKAKLPFRACGLLEIISEDRKKKLST